MTASNQTNIVKNLSKELSENLNINADEFVKEDFDLKVNIFYLNSFYCF
jgi:hypothetical protein